MTIIEMWDDDRTTEHITELVLAKRRVLASRGREIALCVKSVVPKEVVGRAVDLICSRSGAQIYLVRTSSVSGRVALRLLLEFLQNVYRWNDSRCLVIRVVDIDAIEKVLVRRGTRTLDCEHCPMLNSQ
jgi:hypothetical protein